MKRKAIQAVVLSGLFAALTAFATSIAIPVPITHGYVNLGDCMVILSGIVLGPMYGFLAAGIGSALADIIAGFILYSPATFFIKGLMALVVYLISGHSKKGLTVIKLTAAVIIAEIIMILGYFLFELCIYGGSSVSNIPGNCIQGIFGAVGTVVLSTVLCKSNLISKIKPH